MGLIEIKIQVLTTKEILMPIFEFVCQECGTPFEELVRSSNEVDEVTCPSCKSDQVRKQFSTFASKKAGSTGGLASTASTSCSSGSV
jgi:putative FmdB family regulatory protein